MKITEGRCWGWRSSEHPGRRLKGNFGWPMLSPHLESHRSERSGHSRPSLQASPQPVPLQLHAAAEPKMPPRASPWPQALPTSPSPPPPHPQPPMPLTPQSPLEPSWCLRPLSYQHPHLHCKHSFHPAAPPVSPSQQVRSTPLHPGLANSDLRLKSRELNPISTDGRDGKINMMPFKHP